MSGYRLHRDIDKYAEGEYHTPDCDFITDYGGRAAICGCDGTAIVEALVEEIKRIRGAYGKTAFEVEEILAPALGYEHSEEYGWAVGDHVPQTLAAEAAAKIRALQAEVSEDGIVEVKETWGLRVGGRMLEYGYSGSPMRSEADVRSEFDKSVVARGEIVRIRRTVTRTVEDR